MLKLEFRENAWLLAGVLAAGLLFAYGSFSGDGPASSWTSGDLSAKDSSAPARAPENPDLSTPGGTDPYSTNPYDSYSASGQP